MNKTLPKSISDIITHYGAVVAESDEECLEYIAPRELSEKLHIPEYGQIGFTYDSPDEKIIPGYYDSNLFKFLEKFLNAKGKITVALADSITPNIAKLSKVIASSTGFSNATFRMGKVETSDITYTLIVFKYLALSDDKKEGLCFILINESNWAAFMLEESLCYQILNSLKELKGEASSVEDTSTKVIRSAHSAAMIVVQEKLKDFTKSLQRRLNRDIKRVYEYYEALKSETRNLIAKGERFAKKEEVIRLSSKLAAIETEQKWKVQDLILKYVLKVDIEPISLIRIKTQTTRFWIDIKRRSESRAFAITYNSLLKRLDPLPCEACFYPRGFYYVCDYHLHIICAECFKPCAHCKKPYCAACFKNGCPKCKIK